jgi:hypothetical protein
MDPGVETAPQPPGPAAGSARWFALLYCPQRYRREFGLLLALETELGAGLARGLDHALAHARLDWWREEATRHAGGEARHPWLRASAMAPGTAPPRWELGALVDAALVDLAEGRQLPPRPRRLRAAVFSAAAALLAGPAAGPLPVDTLAALGACSAELESGPTPLPPASRAAALAGLGRAIAALGAAHQQRCVALLVWCAIDARADAPPETRSRLALFADNVAAWRAARAASAGVLRLS